MHLFLIKTGAVLSTEVSSVCDDLTDNIFWPKGIRFPLIQEDTPARHILCHEFGQLFSTGTR